VAAVNEVVGTFDGYVPTTRSINDNALDENIVIINPQIGSELAIAARIADQFFTSNKAWTDFVTLTQDVLIAGPSTKMAILITATDTILSAFGKVQAQIDNILLYSLPIASITIFGELNQMG
jgi:hypothetical protein